MFDTATITGYIEYIHTIDEDVSAPLATSILNKLNYIGFSELSNDELFMIVLSIKSTGQHILNDTNQVEVPEGLFYVHTDMAIGDFLLNQYQMGKLNLENISMDGLVSSITLGDTSVSYESGGSSEAKFKDWLERMKKGCDLSCYRRIAW